MKPENNILLVMIMLMTSCSDLPDPPVIKVGSAESKFNLEVINNKNISYTVYFLELQDETMGLPQDADKCNFTTKTIRRSSTLLFENLNPAFTYRVLVVKDSNLVYKVDTVQNIRFPIISLIIEENLSNIVYQGNDTLNCSRMEY